MSKHLAVLIAAAILPALTFAVPAQARTQYPYTLIDLGTFGGPSSFLDLPAIPLTSQGVVLGAADTATVDTDSPNCPTAGYCDGYNQHAFAWRDGRLTDLGALPGKQNSSGIYELNSYGVGAGYSENGRHDPTGRAAGVAVLFKNGQVISLGTLGGADTLEYAQNNVGQIIGASYTNSTPNPANGGYPTIDPYLWQHGHMTDLGTLGGTFGFANWINDLGEVVGQSNLAGDQTAQPFLWKNGHMYELPTIGGGYGFANWISPGGDVTGGYLALPDQQNFHAYLWHDGTMTDLSPVGGAPWAFGGGVNDYGQVVGNETDTNGKDLIAVLWSGGHGYDLNTLVAPNRMQMVSADYITNQGDIVGHGVLPNGDQRMFLLIRNPSVPLSQTRAPLRPLPATGLPDRSASVILAIHATRHGGIAAGIRQLRHAAAMRIRP